MYDLHHERLQPIWWNRFRHNSLLCFHARGDGTTDDSNALLNAIQSIDAGVLFIPEGTYVIARRIDISKGNFVLRGAGPNKTILLFPNSLTDLFGNKAKGTEQSQWAFRPGLLNITGKDPINNETRLADVTARELFFLEEHNRAAFADEEAGRRA